jgi:hypothetical protein
MRYRFSHFLPEIFADLQHGVNALAHRGDAEVGPSPAGSTVVLGPGDELETKTAYPHPHLELIDDALTEAGQMLGSVGKSEIVTELADALRAERSAEGTVIAGAAASGEHDAQLPGSSLVDTAKAGATDVAADPTAIAAVDVPAAPVVEAPAEVVEDEAPVEVVETPAAPVVETPAVETPAAPVVEAPTAG